MNKRLRILSLLIALTLTSQAPAQPDLSPPKLPDRVREQLQNNPPPWAGASAESGQLPKEPPRMTPPPIPEELLRHGAVQPTRAEPQGQFDLLERFLELPPERLSEIRQTIERIEEMDAARKAALLQAIREADQSEASAPSSPARPNQLPAELQSRVDSLPQSQRMQLQAKSGSYTTAEARIAFIEGFLHALQNERVRVGDESPRLGSP